MLKLEWEVDAGPWRAEAPILGLTLKAFWDGDWCVVNPRDADSATFKRAEPATLAAAQEDAEDAATRLLANDAGVRALLLGLWRSPDELLDDNRGWLAVLSERDKLRARVAEMEAALRWIPVTEGLPPEGVDVEASNPCGQPRYIGTCIAGVWADTAGNEWPHTSHWRPLGAGPVAATSADSANLAATAGEGES